MKLNNQTRVFIDSPRGQRILRLAAIASYGPKGPKLLEAWEWLQHNGYNPRLIKGALKKISLKRIIQ